MSCNNCCSCGCNADNTPKVQEFVPRKEYTVGECFKINNEVFKVIRDINWGACPTCDFHKTDNCSDFNCLGTIRTDRTQVQAILYDTEE